MADFDLVIRNGTLADGTGGGLADRDIAIRDGRIAQAGAVSGRGLEEIDARGLLVTPGFVDVHTHYDGQAVWDERLQPSSWHGVTTAVMGNCGVGFAPVRQGDHDLLIELMEGVEDIPGAALHAGLDWSWSSFADYLNLLSQRRFDMDICAQLPHGALRVFVMGARGARLEPANDADMAAMRALAKQAMDQGAIGFSTSRTLNHRTIKGDPTPSLRASEAELTAIALGLKDAGKGVIELISDFDTPDMEQEFAMLRRVMAAGGRPMSISLAQSHRDPDGWRDLLHQIGLAAESGLSVKAQVAPRPIGLLFGLQGSLHPFLMHPSFRAIADQPLAVRAQALKDPAFRARLLGEGPQTSNAMFVKRLTDFARMYALGSMPDYEPPANQSIAARASAQGCDPREIAMDLLAEDGGKGFIFSPFANYARMTLDPCGEMLADANTIPGLGDGGAHVGIISDASFPTHLLTHWGRDRAHGRFDLSWLVKRQTADCARAVGLFDRGLIKPGYKADLNVIDFDKLAIERPTMAYDLPAGGKRLLQRATGYRATIVSGQVTYRDGEAQNPLPGRLVRGGQAAPERH
jgi:N-acyl-D-aspartate/D-glutamate deacylase